MNKKLLVFLLTFCVVLIAFAVIKQLRDNSNQLTSTQINQINNSNNEDIWFPKSKTEEKEKIALPKSAKLPKAFSQFSAHDVLKQVFDNYDSDTGRVSNILNDQYEPSLVRIAQAKLWRIKSKNHLVVMIEIASYDEQVGEFGLCGNCATYSPLAILSSDGNALQLIAKQEVPNRTGDNSFAENNSNEYGSVWFSGHYTNVSLDLTPYRLNESEILIGVRLEIMWIPSFSYSTTLQLYRIEGQKIRRVFDELIVDREYPDYKKKITIEKTTSVLSFLPKRNSSNDLLIEKTTKRCFDKDEDWECGAKDSRVKQIKRQNEVWIFNGTKFIKK